jgi:hypothetical protein
MDLLSNININATCRLWDHVEHALSCSALVFRHDTCQIMSTPVIESHDIHKKRVKASGSVNSGYTVSA